MLAEIEAAIIDRLKVKAPGLAYFDAAKGESILPPICYQLAITRGQAESAPGRGFNQKVNISVWVGLVNLRSDEARRRGVYPLLESLAQMLHREDFGLPCARLRYTGFEDVTVAEERGEGRVVYELSFETHFVVDKQDPEETEELLSLTMKYFLNAAAAPAATDVIETPETP
ncbi:MAG: DUF1834 family protein [Elusimicrobia bacterium]|nr:DUF1834 family protein [Elusimicrobiota bacterium]